MATARSSYDETPCSICRNDYTDPRVLPCGHTFCRQCIEAWSKLACPLCREGFGLPANGVGGLTKNVALSKVVETKELASGCEACSGEVAKAATCPICPEVYTDPRVLPCGHTFCRQCIEAWSELACPVCREGFILPANGVGDLPRNYALLDILDDIKTDMAKIYSQHTGTGIFI